MGINLQSLICNSNMHPKQTGTNSKFQISNSKSTDRAVTLRSGSPFRGLGGRGVLFLALGSPHYARMAANAAASIRFSDKTVPIHLVYSHNNISHLTPQHRALFTSMAECPDEYMHKNGKLNFIKAKT